MRANFPSWTGLDRRGRRERLSLIASDGVCASKEGGLFLYGASTPPVQAELSKLRLDQKLRCRWAVAARVSMLRGVSFLATTVMETVSPLLREGGVDAT